jgi:hypothetical protein
MKFDALKQYAKLRQQLTDEKNQLETRLSEINQVLGAQTTPSPAAQTLSTASKPPARRGRKAKAGNSMSMREAVLMALSKGPLARNELVKAVEGVGYVFTTSNPLNSIGSVLYGKKSQVKSAGGKFYVEGGTTSRASNGGIDRSVEAPAKGKKKRKMSPEGRARIAAAARARWAKVKRT